MAQDHSLQFREPADASHSHISAHPHVSSSLHPSSDTDDSAVQSAGTVDPSHNSASTVSPPPSMERQSSVSKMAHVAKTLIKSPVEEKEHLKLEKTLSKEAKKGEVDVGVMEV